MVRRWRIKKSGNAVNASFNIARFLRTDLMQADLTSLNPKDFDKYFKIMMDEFEFRKLFTNSPDKLQKYENMLENE